MSGGTRGTAGLTTPWRPSRGTDQRRAARGIRRAALCSFHGRSLLRVEAPPPLLRPRSGLVNRWAFLGNPLKSPKATAPAGTPLSPFSFFQTPAPQSSLLPLTKQELAILKNTHLPALAGWLRRCPHAPGLRVRPPPVRAHTRVTRGRIRRGDSTLVFPPRWRQRRKKTRYFQVHEVNQVASKQLRPL